MFSTVVEVTDDRLVLSVSAESLGTLHLQQGDEVEIDIPVRKGRARRRFAPGQLLREHMEIQHELVHDRDWIDAPPVGREIL